MRRLFALVAVAIISLHIASAQTTRGGVGPALTAQNIGRQIFPLHTNESANGFTIANVNFWYDYGDLRRYKVTFQDSSAGVMAANSAAFNNAVQAWKNSGTSIKIKGCSEFHFDTQLSIADATGNNAIRLNFEQDPQCKLMSHVTGSIAGFDVAGFGVLFDGWLESRWYGYNLNYANGTAGDVLRARKNSTLRNEFISPFVQGGTVVGDRETRTRISRRFIGNESLSSSVNHANFWTKHIGGYYNIGATHFDFVVGDGSASTRQPNAQIFLGTQVARYLRGWDFDDTDEHFVSGAWHDNATGILRGTASSVTQAAGTATFNLVAHGVLTGDIVLIAGATPADYNGVTRVMSATADTFTYTKTNGVAIPTGTTSPATGTITATLLTVGYQGNTTFSQIGANIEVGANGIGYFIEDGGSAGNLLQVINNNATQSIVEDLTEKNVVIDRQFYGASGGLTLRVDTRDVFLCTKNECRINALMGFGTGAANSTLIASTNDLDPWAGFGRQMLNLSATGAQTLTGLVPFDSAIIHHIYVLNTDSTDTITLAHESASSAAANRFNLQGNVNLALTPKKMVICIYGQTTSRWTCAG